MVSTAEVAFWIKGEQAATGTVERTIPAGFTASETIDVGMDTSSPVADDYFEQAPFAFNGTIQEIRPKEIPKGSDRHWPESQNVTQRRQPSDR